MKKTILTFAVTAMSISCICNFYASSIDYAPIESTSTSTGEHTLEHYKEIVDKFNQERGLTWQIATPEQIERNGKDVNEVYNDILSMSDEEFWDYLCELYDRAEKENFFNDPNAISEEEYEKIRNKT